MKDFQAKKWLLALLLFAGSMAVYVLTSSRSLMFDDSAEFALVIRLGSIAHSPGFPAYILSGMIWDSISRLFLTDAIVRLNLFSSVLVSTGSVLFFFAMRKIALRLSDGQAGWKTELSAFLPAAIFAFGNTTWLWANTIEVYSFQVFSMGLLLYGLCSYQSAPTRGNILLAAVGLALGWSNHHLTMIVFTPFVPLFFIKDLFISPLKSQPAGKKKKQEDRRTVLEYLEVLKSRDFLLFTVVSAGLTLMAYGWMLWRAQQDYPFMFGKPENLDLLFYHIRGGAYTKNITDTTSSVIASRLPYFLDLTGRQFLLFLPLLIVGIFELVRRRAGRLTFSILGYFMILLIYQLNNNQWASTDAYLLLPFMVLSIPMVYAVHRFFDKWKLAVSVPLLLAATIAWSYPTHNRKDYPVSDSLMKLLDQSAPKNSVVVLSDWSTVIQYYYYRYMEDFRPDLDVIHYDFKFTHHHILPLDNPALYRLIKPEYDRYVEVLGEVHPYQIINTGCDLNTQELNTVFKSLVHKLEDVCKSSGRPLLTDPRCHYMFSTNGFYDPGRFVSGCFSASVPVDSSYSSPFLKMDFPFLSSKMLYDDPSCLDKLVDFQAMLDQHISFYTVNKDLPHLAAAEQAKDKVMRLQHDLKESMSFAYKLK